MKILQIVGYKNSGKTTFASKLIKEAAQKGWKVGALKHHGHGGLPLGFQETDSECHRSAGADITGVIGGNVWQLSTNRPWEISTLLQLYELVGIELLVVEGFKTLPYKKIVFVRDLEELIWFQKLTNIIAVCSDADLVGQPIPYPIIKRNAVERLDWVLEQLTSNQTGLEA